MKAVIMAGGQGSRLRPLTCDLPKPMVPVVNYPVMEYIIKLLKSYNITDIAVTTYYLPQKIEDYFGSGEKWGVNLHYYIEDKPLGTAGSVKNAAEFLDDTFIVISGDAITDFNLEKAVKFHNKKGADATLILSKQEIPLDYGVVMTGEEKEIIRFLEKPGWGQVFSDTINTGIYILDPVIFSMFPEGKKYDFSKELFPKMLEKKMGLYGLALKGYWNDIGSLEEYHKTQFDLLQGNINLSLGHCSKFKENVFVEAGVEIDKSVQLKGNVYIGKGTKITGEAYLEDCIIGRNCRISDDASLKRAVIWDNNLIGTQAEIRGAVLANNISTGKKAAIFDNIVLGANVQIGNMSRLKPGIKIWPDKEIEANSEVDTNIVWPARWSNSLFNDRGIIGESNIDITPEFISRLAVAYGSTLNKADSLVLSSDNYNMSNTLKKAMSAGLQAAGINIMDIGSSTTAITRYSINVLGAAGGVHIRVSTKEATRTVVEFMDEDGIHLSPAEQKGIEKKFFTKGFKRVFISEVGDYSYAPEMERKYLEDLLENINIEEIRRNYFSIVLDYEHDSLGITLPILLKRLYCQIFSTRNYSNNGLPLTLKERKQASSRVSRIMQDNSSDLGIIVDHNGEELNFVKRDAKILNRAEYRVLLSYILLEKGLEKLYVPVNSPRAVETMACEYGAEIEYTPVNFRAPMAGFYHYQDGSTPVFSFYPFSDALAGLVLILEKMAVEGIDFENLLNRLPEFYLNNAEIDCDWKQKGKVMRHLSQDTDEDTELIDGIKFNHPEGWALIIPDSEKSVFHVYAEGSDMESAESLTGFYLDKVRQVIEEEE